jgi:cell division protein FtsB
MGTPNPNPGDIDARLQFLLTGTESLHATVHEMTGQIQQHAKQIDKLAETSERHERENARFNRMMRAALEAYLSDDTGESESQ